MQIVDSSGTVAAGYSYDPYGNVLTATGSLADVNPIRCRGYVYDNETGLYYLQSRYYNPEWGRFINSDSLATTGQGLLGNNMFAYCNNCPVTNRDSGGTTPETIFDIISLASSLAEVIAKPSDPWAWAGLLGDVIDVAVPFVTGVGEMVDCAKTTVRVIDNVDNVVDMARRFRRTADKADDIKETVGSYVVLFKNGNNYVGKGPFQRAIQSAKDHANDGDGIASLIWAPTKSDDNAFIAEYLLQTVRNVKSSKNGVGLTLNEIWSPGRSLLK